MTTYDPLWRPSDALYESSWTLTPLVTKQILAMGFLLAYRCF